MTVIRRTAEGSMAYVKGAPDVLLKCCTHRLRLDGMVEPLDDRQRKAILEIPLTVGLFLVAPGALPIARLVGSSASWILSFGKT